MDAAIVSPAKILPLAKISEEHQQVCRDLIGDRRRFEGVDPETRATEAAFGSGGATVSEGWPWIGLLAVFAVLFGAAGSVAFGPLVDE